MLKKMSIKKIVISLSAFFTLFLIYLIPTSNNNELIPTNEGVEYIDWSAFEGCNDLLSIKFPSSLKGIDRHAFWGATEHLNTVYFY